MLQYDAFLIGSRWADAAGAVRLDVISPIDERVIGRVPESTPADMDAAVAAARSAFDNASWPHLSVEARGAHLLRIMERLRPRLDEIVRVQIEEMGSPFAFANGGTRGTVDSVESQIALVSAIPRRMVRDGVAGKVIVSREPLGVVATIIPWNAPVPLIIARMLPPLLTGSTLVMKPPPETALSALMFAEAVVEAGLPEGVLSIVPGDREVGEYLVTRPGVNKVSFTGSTAAGRRVASLCGENLKHATLELGGKSAAILLDDVDLDRQLGSVIASSLPNNGQICFATTRLLVPRSRSMEIRDRLVTAVAAMKVGDPREPDTPFGPIVSARQRDRVEGYIEEGKEEGATVALGGGRPAGLERGWYVEPTIFADVDNSMRIAQEEIFGPVLCLIDYDSDDEAVAIANDSAYGLGGAVFTSDVVRGIGISERVKTGTFVVNDAPPGGGGGPFGGTKCSGIGRERGLEGYESYYELKAVALPPGYAVEGMTPSVRESLVLRRERLVRGQEN